MSDFSYGHSAGEQTYDKANPSRKIEKGLKRLLLIAAVIIAAQLIWFLGITPFIPFSTIDVQAVDGLSRAEILRIAGITETSSFVSTNVNEAGRRLAGSVLVESAHVTRRFPDRLSIFITQRIPVAVVVGFNGTRQQLLYVDKHGVIFKAAAAGDDTGHLPIISGIESPRLNMQFPPALRPMINSIYVISASSPQLMASISQIRIEPKAWSGFDLILYPVHSSIRVRIENNLTEDVLIYMQPMLNVLESVYPRPQVVDFRSGMGSYIIKEPAVW